MAGLQVRPWQVTAARWLWLLAGLLSLSALVLTVLHVDQLRSELIALIGRQFPREPQATRDRVVIVAVAVLVGAGAFLALSEIVLPLLMRAGGRWSRILLTGIAVLGLLYSAIIIGSDAPLSSAALTAATVLIVAAVVAMFLPASSAWFGDRRHR